MNPRLPLGRVKLDHSHTSLPALRGKESTCARSLGISLALQKRGAVRLFTYIGTEWGGGGGLVWGMRFCSRWRDCETLSSTYVGRKGSRKFPCLSNVGLRLRKKKENCRIVSFSFLTLRGRGGHENPPDQAMTADLLQVVNRQLSDQEKGFTRCWINGGEAESRTCRRVSPSKPSRGGCLGKKDPG